MKLEQKIEGYQRFSPDEARREMGFTSYKRRDTPKVMRYVSGQITTCLEKGCGVILDSAFLSRETRQSYYNFAYEQGLDVVATYVTCSEQTALERIRSRPKSDGLHVPGRNARAYNKYRRRWEATHNRFGTFEQGFEQIGYSGDINLAVNRHVAVLRYDTDTNTVEIKEKWLRPVLRQYAENVRDILLQG